MTRLVSFHQLGAQDSAWLCQVIRFRIAIWNFPASPPDTLPALDPLLLLPLDALLLLDPLPPL